MNSSVGLPVIAVAMCGDNLSIHEVIGLGRNFSSGYICRFCNVQFCDLSESSPNSHRNRNNSTYVDDYKNYAHGIKERCAFEDLVYMDFQWFFPPDCMHDLLEGVSHSVIMLVFQEVLKTINLDDLNSILSNHAFDVSMPT